MGKDLAKVKSRKSKVKRIVICCRLFVVSCLLSAVSCQLSHAAPLTLPQAIDLALKNNDSVMISQRKADAAKAKVAQAFSQYLPALSLQSNYTRNYQSPMTSIIDFGGISTPVKFGIDEAADSKGWQANVSQNIFTFGKLENALMMAMDGAESSVQEFRKSKQDAIYNTTASYLNVLKARKMMSVAQESLDMAKAHYDQVKAMMDNGMAVKTDLLRSEVALLNAKQVSIKARQGVELAYLGFNNSIGAALDMPVEVTDPGFSELAATQAYDFNRVLKDAYQFRPDWKQVNLSRSMAEKSVGIARAQWLPSIAAQGKYGWSNTNYSVANYDTTSWTVTAAAQWTLFDGFNIQAQINEANANYQQSLASINMVKKAVELDAKSAYLNYVSAKDILATAQKQVESAGENRAAAELRYNNGLGTNIDVIDAQAALTKSESDLLAAQFDLLLAQAQIKKASGISDLGIGETSAPSNIFEGTVKYIELEGGFIGLSGTDGRKYELLGTKAEEIRAAIGTDTAGKNVRIEGIIKKDAVSFRMWGTPVEVIRYEWK